MPKFVDRTGQVFGRLTVVRATDDRTSAGSVKWLCKCICGVEKVVSGSALKAGHSSSCGCYFLEVAAEKGRKRATHGMTDTKAYRTWSGMKHRCYVESDKKYADYGGRGIRVCDRWLDSFENFLADMGSPEPDQTIDRMDVDGDYSPTNCRWATQIEQQNNRRDNVIIDLGGERLTMAQYARKHGLNQDKIQQRLARGWSMERAVAP